MTLMKDFNKFAVSNGVSSNTLHGYQQYTNGMISPTIIEERQMNAVTMDVFSRLMAERIIFLGTGINDDVANIITSQLMYLNSIDSESDIKLFINSPGGSVIDGLAIYDVMNWVDADVATYAMGMAASMGSILLSSGQKGKRYSLPHSRVMIHQVSSGAQGQYADLEIAVREAKKYQDELYKILAENTGKPFDQIFTDADRDCWFTSKEALEYGLIDEIITKKK
jgi:ATP-dependent Clp protease protease subunit